MDTDFETHLTIAMPPGTDADPVRAWAAGRGLKFTHIQLSRGTTPSQPMVTRFGRGTLAGERANAAAVAAELAASGWVVNRIKIEVEADDPLAPATDAAATDQPADHYFEAHVKVLLSASADLSTVGTAAARHGAHLSGNARRVRDDGGHERFLTQRGHRVGRATASAALARLLADLPGVGGPGVAVLDVEQEYVVHDSNLAVDAGWM